MLSHNCPSLSYSEYNVGVTPGNLQYKHRLFNIVNRCVFFIFCLFFQSKGKFRNCQKCKLAFFFQNLYRIPESSFRRNFTYRGFVPFKSTLHSKIESHFAFP